VALSSHNLAQAVPEGQILPLDTGVGLPCVWLGAITEVVLSLAARRRIHAGRTRGDASPLPPNAVCASIGVPDHLASDARIAEGMDG